MILTQRHMRVIYVTKGEFMTKLSIDMLIQQLRVYAFAVQGWTKKELAERAGLHQNSMHDIFSDDWSPTIETLRKLEKVIPDDFSFESVPDFYKGKK